MIEKTRSEDSMKRSYVTRKAECGREIDGGVRVDDCDVICTSTGGVVHAVSLSSG